MCNNPNLLPQVNQAKCASIALMVFGVLSLFSFFNLANPWYWNAWAIVFILDGIGGILGVIASSTLICCGGAGIKDQRAKASERCKHQAAMGCGIGAAVCFGAYVIAMLVAIAQLSQCEEWEEVCDGIMPFAIVGMILGLLSVASAVVAAVFAGKAGSAIGAFDPDAVPPAVNSIAMAVPSAAAVPIAVATAVATPA